MEPAIPASPGAAPVRPRVWTVFTAYAAVFVGLQIVGAVLLVALAFLSPEGPPRTVPTPREVERRLEAVLATPAALLLSGTVSSVALAAVALAAAALGRQPVSARLRLGPAPITWGRMGFMVLGLLGLGQFMDSAVALLGWSGKGALGLMSRAMAGASGPTVALCVLVLGLMAGTGEELFFRGYMQTRLRERFGPRRAVAITSLAFGLIHVDPVHTPLATLIGVFLGWATELAGSIRPAILLHVANNALWVLMAALLPQAWPASLHVALLALSPLACAASIVLVIRGPRTHTP